MQIPGARYLAVRLFPPTPKELCDAIPNADNCTAELELSAGVDRSLAELSLQRLSVADFFFCALCARYSL